MIDLYSYQSFVDGVTSEGSKSNDVYMRTIATLANHGMDVPRLSTAAIGYQRGLHFQYSTSQITL